MKMIKQVALVALAVSLIGCGRIETGHVGVRTDFNKQVETTELRPGFYTAFMTNVDEYVVKQAEVTLSNMTPKAKDNLSLQDLDISVFYQINPDMVADMLVKYAGMTAESQDGSLYPMYNYVERTSRGVAYDAVAKFDSLTIHKNRSELETVIKENLQAVLEDSDKGVFTITQVIVRQATTDSALEESIRAAVQMQKQVEAKRAELALAQAEAERKYVEAEGTAKANQKLAESLTPEFLEYKRIEAMREFATQGTHTVLMGSNGSTPLVSVGK